jgi:hypothetical protein
MNDLTFTTEYFRSDISRSQRGLPRLTLRSIDEIDIRSEKNASNMVRCPDHSADLQLLRVPAASCSSSMTASGP